MRGEDFTIRRFEEGDREGAMSMVASAFPLLQRFSLIFDESVWVLELQGRIYGMIKGKTLVLNKGQKVGVIAWLFVEKESQSRGYAGPLMDRLLADFEENHCDEILACAHQLNTGSSGGMTHFGFKPMSLLTQWQAYGSEIFKVWRKSYHVFDYAHILWRKKVKTSEEAHEQDSFLIHALLQIFSLLCMGLVWNKPALWATLVAGFFFLVCRRWVLKMCLMGQGQRELRFQGWDSAHLLATVLSMLLGVWVIAPGMDVPLKDRWRVHHWKKPMFLGSMLWLLVGLSFCGLLLSFGSGSAYMSSIAWVLGMSLLAEHVLFFFPFEGMSGGWIFAKSKLLWVAMSGLLGAAIYALL